MGKITTSESLSDKNIDRIIRDILKNTEKIRIKESQKAFKMLCGSITDYEKNIIENMTKNIADEIVNKKLLNILKNEHKIEILIKYLPYFYCYRLENRGDK